MINFKGSHFEREGIPWGIRWYVAYPVSYRQLEEMLEERGVKVDHSTIGCSQEVNVQFVKPIALLRGRAVISRR